MPDQAATVGAILAHEVLLVFAVGALSSCVHEVNVPKPESLKASRHRAAESAALSVETANAVDLGDGDLTARSLRAKLAKSPGDLDARMALAEHYREQGHPELALDHYGIAAARFPDNAQVRLAAAKTLRQMDANSEASEVLLAYWRSHPKDTPPSLLSELGIVDDDLGKFPDAAYAYRAALVLKPKDAAIHNNLGYNQLLQGRNREAAEEFRRALDLDPHLSVARDNLGIALASVANPAKAGGNPSGAGGSPADEALDDFRSVGGPAIAHNNLAAILIEQGRYPEARVELNRAFGYQRNFPAALDNLRLVSELDGQPATIALVPPPVTPIRRFALTISRALVGSGAQQETSDKTKHAAAQTASPAPEE